MTYLIVTDIATNRIVYCTSDTSEKLSIDNESTVTYVDGPIPVMERTWDYVLINGEFIYKPGRQPVLTKLEDVDSSPKSGLDKTNTYDLLRLIIEKERNSLDVEKEEDKKRLINSEIFRMKYTQQIQSITQHKSIVKLHMWLIQQYNGQIDYETANRLE